MRHRMQAGANAWRKVEGVMMDRKIDRKPKVKALNSCVMSDSNYGLDTLALSKLQQHTLHVSGNNWNKRTTGVKRLEGRITTERRE